MPRRRDERRRVLGPYDRGGEFRIIRVDPAAGVRATRDYPTREKAAHAKRIIEDEWSSEEATTVSAALDAFDEHLADSNSDASRTERMRRLRLFFAPVIEQPVGRLKPEHGAEIYAAFRVGRAADYHRNTLGGARTFLGWCVDKGWAQVNALGKVKGVGRRQKGKAQLTGDEAKRWYAWCVWRAERGDEAAMGLLLLVLLGLRQGDVLKRQVRDVDLDGTVLRVEGGKTAKSNRPRQIPDVLQPLLRELVKGRDSGAPLFAPQHTRAWLLAAMVRFCKAAGVPYVCPHSLKGLAGSVLAETGALGNQIADHLSHESEATSEQHYVRAGAVQEKQAELGMRVLQGGKR